MSLIDPQLIKAIKNRPPSFWVAVSAFLVPICADFLFLFSTRPIPFSSAAWKDREGLRPRMVTDLLEHYDLHGLSRPAIDDLLGVPTGRDCSRGNRYIYWAGTAGIDDMWLEVEFRADRVANVYHIPD